MSALLAINQVLDAADYLARPKPAERMRELTAELDRFFFRARETTGMRGQEMTPSFDNTEVEIRLHFNLTPRPGPRSRPIAVPFAVASFADS